VCCVGQEEGHLHLQATMAWLYKGPTRRKTRLTRWRGTKCGVTPPDELSVGSECGVARAYSELTKLCISPHVSCSLSVTFEQGRVNWFGRDHYEIDRIILIEKLVVWPLALKILNFVHLRLHDRRHDLIPPR
jgi:hypothetical protein